MIRRPALALALLAFAAPVAAQEPAVARVAITPARVEVMIGDTVRLSAVAYDAAGRPVDTPIRWLTSYEVGRVDSTGAFVGLAIGDRAILAMAGEVSGSVPVTVRARPPAAVVMAVPATTVTATSWLPLDARAVDEAGRIVFDAAMEWSSSDPAVAEVVGPFLVARRPGATTLTARSGPATASGTITVTAPPAGALALAAPAGPIRTGDVHRLAPTVQGRALPDGAIPRYSVTGPGGRVWPDGAFVAETPGEYVVAAELGGSSTHVAIRVEPRQHDLRFERIGHAGVPAAHTADLWVIGDVAYLGTFADDKLRVLDISDPAHPVLTDSIQVDARRINDVTANPDRGFAIMTREGAADRRNGIVILDITDPRHPTIASEYTETVSGGVHTTWIVDELVYLTHNGTGDMKIIDVSDRANPRQVGSWGIDSPNPVLHDIFVKDGIAYLSYWDDGLVILDLGGAGKGGTPTEPVFVSRIYYPEGNTHTAWRWKDYVFVGDEIFPDDWDMNRPIDARGYLHVIDVSDLENPVEVATYEVPEAGAHNIWIEDDEEILYLAYYQAGLRALDVSGELRGDLYAQGREVDRYATSAPEGVALPNVPFAATVMLKDGRIYTVDLNSGLWIHHMVPAGDRPIS
ncbi:MAG TPA: Ig-like domain-containing protein [Gemmatimonadota bacterium]|nr:Ig-like domain-containing protein [Gemmatimonadota bacterium]